VILNGSQKSGNRHPEGLSLYMGIGDVLVHHRRVIQFLSLEPKEKMKLAQRQNMGENLSFHV
jgi:hypothetical protein